MVSEQLSLGEAHALLFQNAGYPTIVVDAQSLARTLKAVDFAVVVVDDTLSKLERKSAVTIIHTLTPHTRTVAVHFGNSDQCGADLELDSREGASVMLGAVEKLLNGTP